MGMEEAVSNEHLRSQEIIELEYKTMNTYFTVAGIPKEMQAQWVNENGEALRRLADNDPEFLRAYSENPDATKEEFESKLQEYL